MRRRTMFGICTVVIMAGGIFFGQVPAVYAGPMFGGPHAGPRARPGERFPRGPHRYFLDGFYRIERSGAFIRTPIGTIILQLPAGHRTMIVETQTYYCYDGIYYVHSPRGYVVVPPPYICCKDYVETTMAEGGTVTVNIPDVNGSYTAVELKRSGSGYLGPQGEYYPEHPTVSQLSVLYGK